MAKQTFTTAFNRSTASVKDVNCKKFTSPSKVKQSLSYAVDINTIYDQYCKTGKLPLNGQRPIYDENFVKYDSLIEASKMVDEATLYFVGLPADIKNQYGNNMYEFIKALNKGDQFLIDKGVLHIKQPDVKPVEDTIKTDVEIPSTSANPVTEPVNTATTD